jgi:hypothetical protein
MRGILDVWFFPDVDEPRIKRGRGSRIERRPAADDLDLALGDCEIPVRI